MIIIMVSRSFFLFYNKKNMNTNMMVFISSKGRQNKTHFLY